MFDHMVEVNGLQASFEKYNLDHSDKIFIKELIRGAPLPKVPKNEDYRIKEMPN